MFVARDGAFLEKEFISKKSSGSKIHLEEVRDEQQTDVDHTMSEAAAQGSNELVLEQANSNGNAQTVPLEFNSCENLQRVEENISTVAPNLRRASRIRNKQVVDVMLIESSKIFLVESLEPITYKKALRAQIPRNGLRP